MNDLIPDIDNQKFKELFNLEKSCNNFKLDVPPFGEQAKYGITAIFDPKQAFTALLNRKGHIRTDNLTFIMHSTTNGMMVRYDVSGADHNGLPTPHLHIFDSLHHNGRDVITGDQLGNLKVDTTSPDLLIRSLERFLKFNHVALDHVIINGSMI